MSSAITATSRALARFIVTKRALDTLVVLATAPLVLPIIGVVSLIVAADLGRPIFYRQSRVGRDERTFEIIKFRTMTAEGPSFSFGRSDAQRLTPTGRVLRKLSLDELPQVINVLRGDMAIVGPRPLLERYLPFYSETEASRHLVRPGITGLAQTRGRNGLLWDARLALDVEYVRRRSLALDIEILARTVGQVVRRRDVSVVAGDSGEPLDIVRSYPRDGDLALRRFEGADIPARVSWLNDPRVRATLSLVGEISEPSTRQWMTEARADPERVDFTVYSISDGDPLAMAGLRRRSGEALPELYLFVAPDRHGHGIGRASLLLVLEWMRRTRRFDGCWLTVASDNDRAASLYLSSGFRPVDGAPGSRPRLELMLSDSEPS